MRADCAGDAPAGRQTEQPAGGPIIVVGAAILAGRGGTACVLSARRAAPPELAGYWELPGGKVEAGETESAALTRECREELGVEVVPGPRLGGDITIGSHHAVLRVFTAALVAGEPMALEHTEVRWLSAAALDSVAWLPADRPLLADLRALLLG